MSGTRAGPIGALVAWLCSAVALGVGCDTDCRDTLTCEELGAGGGKSPLPTGEACAASGECASDFCVDGVCCESACDAACEVCGNNGMCGNTPVGADPDGDCGGGSCSSGGVCATGDVSWLAHLSSSGTQRGHAVTATPDGGFVVAGIFENSITIGKTTETAVGAADIFVVKYSGRGDVAWHRTFGSAGLDSVNAIAVGPDGSVALAGGHDDMISFGGTELTALGGWDAYVAKLDADGNHLWSRGFAGDATYQMTSAVAIDSTGAVIVGGNFSGSIDLGDGPMTSLGGSDVFKLNLFVGRFDTNGTISWSNRFGETEGSFLGDLALDTDDNILLAGTFFGSLAFGGAPLVSNGGVPPVAGDMFVAKLTNVGTYLWSKRYGGVEGQSANAVTTDANDNVLFTGYSLGPVDFGAGPVGDPDAHGIVVAKLDSNAAPLWAHVFEEQGTAGAGDAIVTTSDGDAIVTGVLFGVQDFGGGTLSSNGDGDIFALKLTSDGIHLWSHGFGAQGSDRGWDVDALSDGRTVLVGHFEGTVDFGSSSVVGTGGADAFFALLEP